MTCQNPRGILSHATGAVFLSTLCCLTFWAGSVAPLQAQEFDRRPSAASGTVIVHPKLGGQILGYDVDQNGTQGILSEFVILSGGTFLVATETFDQRTGKITEVIAKENHTQDDYVTEGIFGDVGLDLYQHAGKNHFLTLKGPDFGKFAGVWTPPIKQNYQLWTTSRDQGTPDVAAYQSSFDTGLTYVFRSNIAKNTFGRQISLKPLIDKFTYFFHPQIALNAKTDQAVLADSQGCPEPEPACAMSVALVDLTTGKISEFNNDLGVGQVNGLAVDPVTNIACTTTSVDQGVEFYDLTKKTGFEVQLPGVLFQLDSGLDVEFDSIHKVFLVDQYSSTGNPNDPQPRVYVYDEKGNLQETISIQRIGEPAPIALNPGKRIGFTYVIVEPQHEALELQSFTY